MFSQADIQAIKAFLPEKPRSLLNTHDISNQPLKEHRLSLLNACRTSSKCYVTRTSLHVLSTPKSPKAPCTALRGSMGHLTLLPLRLCSPVWGKPLRGAVASLTPFHRPQRWDTPRNAASPEDGQELGFALGYRCTHALSPLKIFHAAHRKRI